MNLVNCDENCQYQQDGYCKLNHNPVINSVKVNGCSYFTKRKPRKKLKNNADSK